MKRSNYAETNLLAGEDDEEGVSKKGRARQTISDKRNLNILGSSAAAKKKKSTMSVRTALLYRKNLATLIEESVSNATWSSCALRQPAELPSPVQNIASLPPSIPTYLTSITPPSAYPPRMLCSVCGYWGAYRCRRCAMPYCDRNCEAVHAETRCEKRVV